MLDVGERQFVRIILGSRKELGWVFRCQRKDGSNGTNIAIALTLSHPSIVALSLLLNKTTVGRFVIILRKGSRVSTMCSRLLLVTGNEIQPASSR